MMISAAGNDPKPELAEGVVKLVEVVIDSEPATQLGIPEPPLFDVIPSTRKFRYIEDDLNCGTSPKACCRRPSSSLTHGDGYTPK